MSKSSPNRKKIKLDEESGMPPVTQLTKEQLEQLSKDHPDDETHR